MYVTPHQFFFPLRGAVTQPGEGIIGQILSNTIDFAMEWLADNTQFAPLGASTRRLQTSDHKDFTVLFSIADFQFSGVAFPWYFKVK